MNYLLDTNVFLWMLSAPDHLSPEAASVIRNPDRAVLVSAVKQALVKLEAPSSLGEEIRARGLQEPPLRYTHGERMLLLPAHHADPFDRMMLAQAAEEDLVVITHDRKFIPYPAKILWTQCPGGCKKRHGDGVRRFC
jgi:PIN domain nuclease of toxin-antitoxin system